MPGEVADEGPRVRIGQHPLDRALFAGVGFTLLSFFFSSRRRHTRWTGDWSSDVCSSDLDRLGLRTVIDFRTPGEVLLGGDDRLPFAVEYAHLPVSGGDLGSIYELIASGDQERQRRELGGGRAASFMVEMNRGFVADARQ